MLNVNHADVYTDFNGLSKLKTEAKKDSQEALKEVAKQFESIFLNMALKSMRDAKLSDGIMDSDQSQFYQEMYDQQLAVHLSGNPGVGLADLIIRQLSTDKKTIDQEPLDLQAYRNKPVIAPQVKLPEKISDAVKQSDKSANEIKQPSEITEIKLKSSDSLPITSVEQFVKQLWPYAQQAANEIGVEPKVLLAQAALETGWGKSVIDKADGKSSFNLFNIKADKSWKGSKTSVNTLEFVQGTAKKVRAGFRVYDSYQQSFQDYVQFLKRNPRYGEALKQTADPEAYVKGLQQAGYGTDPKYADKIMHIYNGKALTQYQPTQIVASN
jgi:flagellar protein FlgJ